MFNAKNDYWFTIEPYTYVYIKSSRLLLFNTLDGAIIETEDEEVIELVKKTLSEENLSVSFFEGKRLLKKNTANFIENLRETFMGDIIDTQYSNHKPIQFVTQANVLDIDFEKQKSLFFSDLSHMNIMPYLDEVTIVINGGLLHSEFTKQTWLYKETLKTLDFQISLDIVKEIGMSLKGSNVTTVNIIGADVTAHSEINEIVSFFKTLPFKVEYIQYAGVGKYDYATSIILDTKQLAKLDFHFNNDNVTYLFIVETDGDIEFLQLFVEENGIEHYKVIPYFTNDNLDFFEENVYLNKDDLENEPQKLNDIFAKRFINLNSFGKLFIAVNGDVYSNLFAKPLGTFKNSFKDIMIKELSSENSAWRNVRKAAPCCDCIYQWLCPSPSNYEQAIGKSNLCHVCV